MKTRIQTFKKIVLILSLSLLVPMTAIAGSYTDTGSAASFPESVSEDITPMWHAILHTEGQMLSDAEKRTLDMAISMKRGAALDRNTADAGKILCHAVTELQIKKPNDADMRLSRAAGNTFRIERAVSDIEEEKAIKEIISAFPVFSAPDPRTRMQDICRSVRRKLRFDYEATWSSVPASLKSGTGVCAQQAVCAYVLANWYGIPCRRVYGTRNGGITYHTWVEAEIDGQRIPFDPCMFADGEFPEGVRFTEIDDLTYDIPV